MKITKDVENKLIREQIPEVSQDLVYKILIDTQYRRDEIEFHTPSYDDRLIQIPSLKGSYCFRIQFRLPVTVLIPKSAQLLTGIIPYYKSNKGTFPIAYVAAYSPNLNHFSLIRLHGNRVRDYFSDARQFLHNDACVQYINEEGTPMEFSSLNFLERQNTVQRNLPEDGIQVIRRCFEFSFWKIPPFDMNRDYSAMHHFIYNNNARIRAIYRVFKTILKIEELRTTRRRIGFIPQDFSYLEATARFIAEDGDAFTSKKSRLIIAEPSASSLKVNDIITCLLVAPQKIRGEMPPGLVLIGSIGSKIMRTDYRSVMSMVFWKLNQRLSFTSKLLESLPKVELKEATKRITKSNHMLLDPHFLDNFDENFEESLAKMHPCFIQHYDRVYSIPPPLLNYLITNNFSITKKPELFAKLVDLINTIEPKDRFFDSNRRMAIRTSQLACELQKSGDFGNKWEEFLWNLPRLSNRMVYARIISQPAGT